MLKLSTRSAICFLLVLSLPLTLIADNDALETEKIEEQVAEEQVDPIPAHRLFSSPELTVYHVQPHFKVYPKDPFEVRKDAPRKVGLSRGEYEPFQIVVRSASDLSAVTVQADELPRGVSFECQPVGLVDIKLSKVRDGMTPDPLHNDPEFDVTAETSQAYWITLYATRDAKPGAFSMNCRLLSNERELATFKLPARVYDFPMPARPHLASMVEFRPWNDGGHYKDKTGRITSWPLERREKVYRAYYRWYKRNRIQPGSVFPRPAVKKGDNGEFYIQDAEQTAAVISKLFKDFPGVFDVFWVRQMMGYGKTFSHPESKKGKDKIEYVKKYVTTYLEFARRNGWPMDRVVWYAGDEPIMPHAFRTPSSKDTPIASINAAVRAIRPVLRGIPVFVSAWPLDRELLSSVDIWSGRSYGHPSREPERMQLKESISYGKALALTTDNSYNILMDRQAINHRMDPMHAWYAGVPMIEHWSNMFWQKTPWNPSRKWFSETFIVPGDGNLVYPPPSFDEVVSSIRAELMREGMEDYEYLWLLRHASYVIRTGDRVGEESDLIRRIDTLLWDMQNWIVNSTSRHSDSDYLGMCSNVPADQVRNAADELDSLRAAMQKTLEEVNRKGFLDEKVIDAGQKPIREWFKYE